MDGTQTLSWDHPMSLGSVPSWNSLGRNNLSLGTWTSNSASSLLGLPSPSCPGVVGWCSRGPRCPKYPIAGGCRRQWDSCSCRHGCRGLGLQVALLLPSCSQP